MVLHRRAVSSLFRRETSHVFFFFMVYLRYGRKTISKKQLFMRSEPKQLNSLIITIVNRYVFPFFKCGKYPSSDPSVRQSSISIYNAIAESTINLKALEVIRVVCLSQRKLDIFVESVKTCCQD